MWSEIFKLGLPAAIAVLLTAAAVVWINPEGIGGVFLIFLVCLAISYVAVRIIGRFSRSS